LTGRKINPLDNEHHVKCIGIKACGALPKGLDKYYPQATKYLKELLREDNFIVGEVIDYVEDNCILLFMVTSSARLRDTDITTIDIIRDILTIYIPTPLCNDIAVISIVNGKFNGHPLQDHITSTFNKTFKVQPDVRITFYD